MAFSDILMLMSTVLLASISVVYYQDMAWETVNIDKLGYSYFTDTFLPPWLYAILRGICCLVIVSTLSYIATDNSGLEIVVLREDGSKHTVLLKHFERFTMFTVWSWVLQVITNK